MGLFENIRLFGINQPKEEKVIPIEEDYAIAIAKAEENLVTKGMNGKDVHFSKPIMEAMSMNPGFKTKPSVRHSQDLHQILKKYSSNIILNTIINTRANQVSMYCQPSRYSEKGVGYKVRLKDLEQEETTHDKKRIKDIENFLENTGVVKDPTRDNLTTAVKKMVRDTYRYDQVNFEKVFDREGNFLRFTMVDASTIFFGTDSEGRPLKHTKYVQVIDNRIVAQFSPRELAFAVRNPRTDIEVGGYGFSELEIALKQFIAHDNTETFNDRFFSHGGTTRGVLQIKTGQEQSTHALDIFRREWRNSLSGINGSWQIPVVSAEDVKFVNMTPSGRDMEFEKWLNYLINVITALYGIDPSEINFPNNGGATGSKGGALNEGNAKDKYQASQNKGLQPLLRFIEDTVNTYILPEFDKQGKYIFQFVGGDTTTELEKIKVLGEKAKIAITVNEVRRELGIPGDLAGGDVIMNGVHIQRLGQLMQQEQFEYQVKQEKLQMLMEMTNPPEGAEEMGDDLSVNPVDIDEEEKEDDYKVDLDKKDQAEQGVGKDGQVKGRENTNSGKQGMKGKKPNDWQKKGK